MTGVNSLSGREPYTKQQERKEGIVEKTKKTTPRLVRNLSHMVSSAFVQPLTHGLCLIHQSRLLLSRKYRPLLTFITELTSITIFSYQLPSLHICQIHAHSNVILYQTRSTMALITDLNINRIQVPERSCEGAQFATHLKDLANTHKEDISPCISSCPLQPSTNLLSVRGPWKLKPNCSHCPRSLKTLITFQFQFCSSHFSHSVTFSFQQ